MSLVPISLFIRRYDKSTLASAFDRLSLTLFLGAIEFPKITDNNHDDPR
jgi:hypothetical protein